MKPISIYVNLILFLALFFSGCLKKGYDAPPDTSSYDPMLKIDITIAGLKLMNGLYDYTTGGDTTVITTDLTIAGIVTANDRSGNLYNAIVIEDSSGAITVKIDATNLYNDYPVGRKVYIKCKGLTLGYDGGLPVLGYHTDAHLSPSGIPLIRLKEFIVPGTLGHVLVPETLTVAEAKNGASNSSLYNKLVVITDSQFEDTGIAYAQPNGATNRDIVDCAISASKLAVRTSNYASFSHMILPAGKGAITGIYTVFISPSTGTKTPQLVIRDTSDVRMRDARCNNQTNPPATKIISLASLRSFYQGTGIKLGSYLIKGIVISEAITKNVSSGSIILQDGNKGIAVYWGGTLNYDLGDSLLIDVTGDSLIMFQGALEIKRASSVKPAPLGTGRSVIPQQLTVAQLNANFAMYESTLVKITNAIVAGGGTYSGSRTLSDGTGSIILYTSASAFFAGQAVPTTPKTFVGIATPFTGGVKEVKLRNPAIDVY